LDKVIDNIQVENVESTKPIVPITKPTQPIVVATKSSQPVQPIVELVQIENP
jgi:hypothetical protein